MAHFFLLLCHQWLLHGGLWEGRQICKVIGQPIGPYFLRSSSCPRALHRSLGLSRWGVGQSWFTRIRSQWPNPLHVGPVTLRHWSAPTRRFHCLRRTRPHQSEAVLLSKTRGHCSSCCPGKGWPNQRASPATWICRQNSQRSRPYWVTFNWSASSTCTFAFVHLSGTQREAWADRQAQPGCRHTHHQQVVQDSGQDFCLHSPEIWLFEKLHGLRHVTDDDNLGIWIKLLEQVLDDEWEANHQLGHGS